ncbi:dihydroorotate dehydrogenase electron transfer subunit [bacterium]|nr:dihydroorotate dehydrogenase electron transfer subunit [bacterium]
MQFKSMVVSNVEISPGYRRVRLTAPRAMLDARPGQFVMLRVRDGLDPLLRRPFCVFDTGSFSPEYPDAPRQHYFDILYRVVGKGTAILASLHSKDYLDVLGPLGNGFSPGDPHEEKILVGGGIGLAPLYFLARELAGKSPLKVFIGGKRKEDVLCVTEFEQLGIDTYVATDDGTLGTRGLVTEVLEENLSLGEGKRTVFACGPEPMLQALATICAKHGICCQVSLEANMACGVGACLGCVVKGGSHSEAAPDYRCVCKEGPVFDAAELSWNQAK